MLTMRLRHVTSAAIVSAALAAVYGRVAWGMFVRVDDNRDHLLIAQRLYETGDPGVRIFSSTH